MPLEERDIAYLLDMVAACHDVVEFTNNVTFAHFERDKMRRLATERQLGTLGEAANHVSSATQQHHPEIEWPRIVALRNKLSHDYGEVLARRVWQIAMEHVPALLNLLLQIPEVAQYSECDSDQ